MMKRTGSLTMTEGVVISVTAEARQRAYLKERKASSFLDALSTRLYSDSGVDIYQILRVFAQ